VREMYSAHSIAAGTSTTSVMTRTVAVSTPA
jgi:hypothetical protein